MKKISKQLYQYMLLMRWHRPIGILLVLWPALWGLVIAGQGKPSLKNVLIFILGAILARSAGCVINDFADRNFDKHVARTKDRPLTAGQVSTQEAWLLFIILGLIAFGLILFLNPFTIFLAFIAIALTAIYPFMKRITQLPQLFLGITFNWGVLMAFAAQINAISLIAWLLWLIACIWTVIYDTFYAMTDREDDLRIGIKSTAILFGKHDKLITATLQLIMLILLIMLGLWQQFHFSYYLSLLVIVVFMLYQQYLIKNRVPINCFKAFINNHWVGMVLFLGILFNYYF